MRKVKMITMFVLVLCLFVSCTDIVQDAGAFLTSPMDRAPIAAGQSKFLGNVIADGNNIPSSFSTYWNQITPENSGKWGVVEATRDVYNWSSLDKMYAYAKANGYPFKQHTFVWGSQEPSWIGTLSAADQKAEVEEWIKDYCARFPNTDFIDVVNEPLHAPASYREALGGAGTTGWDWVIWAFETTRKYTTAKLLINDYNISLDNTGTTNYLTIINLLKSRGLIDGIGDQAHSHETVDVNIVKANLDRLAATGLPIYISELDLRGDDATQLSLYQKHFPVFWTHTGVKGVTLWGYIEGAIWRTEAYLLSTTGVERPALVWLRQYVSGSAATATSTRTATATTVTRTATATTITRTATRTATSTTITRTSTRTATSGTASRTATTTATTVTRTATATSIGTGCTCDAGCSTVVSITPNFSKDGAGQFCYSGASLGNYINSWNLTSLKVNGVDLTNKWVAKASLPAAIGGLYYVYYNSAVAYGHFEAMN